MLHRRTFLQLLSALPGLTLIRPARQLQPPVIPAPDLTYTDSSGTSSAQLRQALTDHSRATGITYGV